MLCSRCKERPAVVFVTKIENNETVNEGLCLKCAKELNIKPISQMIEQLGISDEEFDEVCDQMSSMMGDGDGLSAPSVDGFEEGGAQSMNLFQKLFGGLAGMQPPANGAVSPESKPDSSAKNEEKDGKKDKKEQALVGM